MTATGPLLLFVVLAIFGEVKSEYYGKLIGKLSELHHGVSGEVYAVDGRTLYIKDYTYDGQGPAAYFYASTYKTPDSKGFRLRDENNNGEVIRKYRKEGVTLTLPEGKTLSNIKVFYVYCEEFDVSFGDVKIPRSFDYPRPQKIDALKGVHEISSDNIVVVDAQTLLIPNLHYDGEAPDAKFWVGRGPKPSPQGIRVADENGKEVPLRRYDGKTVVLTLPGDLTVFDIGHFGIWCEQFTVDFGHIQIPQQLNIPPSLKMLGVSPQSKLNCEVLNEKLSFEVRWAVAGESIVLQLVGKLDEREYMSFGLSGVESRSEMIGGDVVVAWVDKQTLKGYAQDYYLQDKSQCSGPSGSCPDNKFQKTTDNIRLLNAAMVNGYSIVTYQRPLKASDEYDQPIYTNQSQAIIWAVGPLNQRDEVSFHSNYLKGDSFINFARPAKWNCPHPESDSTSNHKNSPPIQNRNQDDVSSAESVEPIIPSRTTVQEDEPVEPPTSSRRKEGGNRRRGSGNRRQPATTTEEAEEVQATKREPTRTRISNRDRTHTVPPPTPVKNGVKPWYIPPIECYEPENGVFYAQMGPTGGKRGYPAITGHVGWGISWYINGLLIPEIHVVRGKAYTFIAEGGDNPDIPAKYHPFYITDDPIGGYVYKNLEERKNITVFAGVSFDKKGEPVPTGGGRSCNWTPVDDVEADDFESFGAYQRHLELRCDAGDPGIIEWTPDQDTPDTVYYQCFSHRHLGWKIHVHDTCEQEGAASELQQSIVEAPKETLTSNSELEASASIRQETMVIPSQMINRHSNENLNQPQPTISDTIESPQQTPIGQHKRDTSPSFLNPYSQVNSFLPYLQHQRDQGLQYRVSSAPDLTLLTSKHVTTTARPTTTNKLTQETYLLPSATFQYNNFALPGKMNLPPKLYKSSAPQQIFYLPMKQLSSKPVSPFGFKKPLYIQPPIKNQKLVYNIRPSDIASRPNAIKTPQFISNTLPMTLSIPVRTSTVVPSGSIPTMPFVQNVEISPQQASTEREPEIQTASSLMSVHPTSEETVKYQKPDSKGFNPDSIVIESGFKPIIHNDFKERADGIGAEVDLESEMGIIKIQGENKFETIPTKSKLKKVSKAPMRKKEIVQIIVRNNRNLIDSDIEPEMAASDNSQSYYLPPADHSEKPLTSQPKQPSAIDFEAPTSKLQDKHIDTNLAASPPDVVVTFDGKRVSGASLTAKPYQQRGVLERGSKATEYLKTLPQSVPYRGELPPLTSNVLFSYKGHSSSVPSKVLNRDLDTPLPPPPAVRGGGTTKLKRVRRVAYEVFERSALQMEDGESSSPFLPTALPSVTSGSTRLMGGYVWEVLIVLFVSLYVM